ncbi:MAG: rRNA maturation RNAse YbeY, partial [Nitrospiraceae bacterium]
MPVVRRFDKAHRRLRSPQVFIRSRLRRYRLVQAEVRRLAQRILTQVSRGQAPADAWLKREPVPCELSLDFVGDRRMRRLNREYRGRDLPTDVLAFP